MRFKGNTARTRIRKDSKTLPIYGDPIKGDGLDSGIWFRCWYCGFVCNARRDTLGDSQSRDGRITRDYSSTNNAIMISESSFGCPLCATLNWRGDY